jgi:hypothetical protein
MTYLEIADRTLDTPIARARELARDTDQPYIVAEIDHEDTRLLEIHPLAYADSPEFVAFDGVVVVIAYPDGTIE